MDEDQSDDNEGGGQEAAAQGLRGRLPGRKVLLFGAVPAVLVIGLVATYALGGLDSMIGAAPPEATASVSVFYDLPELLVNLSSQNNRSSYLKLRVSLELAGAELPKELDKMAPRIVDNFQVYLRELRASDLEGSSGMFRLKEELLARVNMAVAPVKVSDVLFKEMLVQ
jgi:flagellar FliL protein